MAAAPSNGIASIVVSTRWRRSCRAALSRGSPAAWVPAASSARVMVEMATSCGKDSAAGRSMTTEVSIRPRTGRASGAREDILVDQAVEVLSESSRIEAWGAGQGLGQSTRRNESRPARRGELANRNAVSGHDERLSAVQGAHDFAALIAELPLGDLPGHRTIVAHVRHLDLGRIPDRTAIKWRSTTTRRAGAAGEMGGGRLFMRRLSGRLLDLRSLFPLRVPPARAIDGAIPRERRSRVVV